MSIRSSVYKKICACLFIDLLCDCNHSGSLKTFTKTWSDLSSSLYILDLYLGRYVVSFFQKIGHFRPLYLCLSVQWIENYFDDDWVQTTDLWCRKRLLYQLSHNHCPPRDNFTNDIQKVLLLTIKEVKRQKCYVVSTKT